MIVHQNLNSMKQVLLVMALLAPVVALSQKMNGMDLGQMSDVKYMEVVVSKVPFSKTYFAKADFGQGLKTGEHGFEDENGKDKEFKSEIHVINWLWVLGWDLMRDWQEGEVRHFLMQRGEANK